ncbi:uncharacterized protein [Diadema antillarum]|uniref:uncharacterized protein n=1 Tax=Diadema antillarum TaxID=105358 RepID=UPI003A8471E1
MFGRPLVKTNVRVVRGPDWPAGHDDDGGEGGIGTVTDVDEGLDTVYVAWDCGRSGKYVCEPGERHSLRVYNNAGANTYHEYVTCDGCLAEPIRGIRWRCLDCENYDLCTSCYMDGQHESNHGFVRVTNQASCGIPVPVRKGARTVGARGFLPGTLVTICRDNEEMTGEITHVSSSGDATVKLDGSSTVEEFNVYEKRDADSKISLKEHKEHPVFIQHLPLLGDDPDIHPGDRVVVCLPAEEFERLQRLHSSKWNTNMMETLGHIGIVFEVRRYTCIVAFGNGSRYFFNPEVCTKLREFKKLDIVQITDDEETLQRMQQAYGLEKGRLVNWLGREVQVRKVHVDGRLSVRLGTDVDIHPACVKFVRNANVEECTNVEAEATASREKSSKKSSDGGSSSDDDGDIDVDDEKTKLLFDAVRSGNQDVVRDMLAADPTLVKAKRHGAGAIHYAASRSEVALKMLIEAGADTNMKDKKGSAPLHYATEADESECIRLLLDNQAEVNATNHRKVTSLHVTATNGYDEVARILLQAGADVNAQENQKLTSFHLAAVKGFVECARVYIEFGCDINVQDKHGDTPAHDAIRTDSAVFDIILKEEKFDPSIENKKGFNLIHYAALRGKAAPLAKLLDRAPALINLQRDDGHTAIHIAAYNGHLDCVKTLLEHNCDPDLKNTTGETALYLAVKKGHAEEVESLLAAAADVNIPAKDGNTCLHTAAILSNDSSSTVSETATLRELKTKYRKYGVTTSAVALVCLLTERGADITARNKQDKTPLSLLGDDIQTLLQKMAAGESIDFEPTQTLQRIDSVEGQATIIEGLSRISVGEIRMEELIGTGSFGDVHKAKWRGTNVAVKTIQIDEELRERVEQQLSVHRQTTHPNIVELMALSYNPAKSEIIIVMEFIDGQNLHELIFFSEDEDEIDLSKADKISIAQQICQAINFIHQSRILHLDIKPSNILIESKDKKPHLSDIGLAHINYTSDTLESSFGFRGTPYYVPPEAVDPSVEDKVKFSPAYDIWSLGGALLEMFTEKRLWGDDMEGAYLMVTLMTGEARPPVLDNADQRLKEILEPCFSIEPKKRPTASQLLEQFQKLRPT